MDTHVVTPQGIEQALSDARFICNASTESAERFMFDRCTIGDARATTYYTAEQLARQGIVGIYERPHA